SPPARIARLCRDELFELRLLERKLLQRLGKLTPLLRYASQNGMRIRKPVERLWVGRVWSEQPVQRRKLRKKLLAGAVKFAALLSHVREVVLAAGELAAPGRARRVEGHERHARVVIAVEPVGGCGKLAAPQVDVADPEFRLAPLKKHVPVPGMARRQRGRAAVGLRKGRSRLIVARLLHPDLADLREGLRPAGELRVAQ